MKRAHGRGKVNFLKTRLGFGFWRGIRFALAFSIPLWGLGAWGGVTTFKAAWHHPKHHMVAHAKRDHPFVIVGPGA
jgi:hypothetical protein